MSEFSECSPQPSMDISVASEGSSPSSVEDSDFQCSVGWISLKATTMWEGSQRNGGDVFFSIVLRSVF